MASLNRFINILRILLHSNGGIRYLVNSASSVSSFSAAHLIKKYIKDLNTIIDAGANKGQFAAAVNRFFPEAKIYSFEPIPEVFEKLKYNIRYISNIYPFNLALGSKDGRMNFYVNSYSPASSALTVSETQEQYFPETKQQRKISVPVRKLDTVLSSFKLASPVLLKSDVQGYEKEVLQGADSIIRKMEYLLLETSFTAMYEGEPLFEEILYYVNSLNFHLIAPVGLLTGNNGQIMQMDILFRNDNIK